MSELLEIFTKFNCDKGVKGKNAHHYYTEYEKEFEPVRNEPLKILEVGIFTGTSFDSWHEYLPNAEIYGIDIFTRLKPSDVPALKKDRVHYIKDDSTKESIKNSISNKWSNDIKFDYIIDDGLHTPEANKLTFENLVPFLKDGGVFYVEDVWPLHIMTDKEMNDPWVMKKSAVYNKQKMSEFIEVVSPYHVEEIDLRKVSGRPDSYIYKVTK